MKFNRLIRSNQNRSSMNYSAGTSGKAQLSTTSHAYPGPTSIESMILMSASAEHSEAVSEALNIDGADSNEGPWALSEGELLELTNSVQMSERDSDQYAISGAAMPGSDLAFLSCPFDSSANTLDPLFPNRVQEVVFVDRATPDYQEIVADLMKQLSPDRDTELILLDRDRGIDQIEDFLQGLEDVAAVHIVSHGAPGNITLGNEQLSLDNLPEHLSSIESWADSLTADADVLFYGCNLASNESGQRLVHAIADACQCDVAASDDATGHELLGGDWDLEFQVGEVETLVPFSDAFQDDWEHVLDLVSDFNSSSTSTQLGVTGTNSGWTVTQGSVDFFANGYFLLDVPNGGRAVNLNSLLSAAGIEATLATVAGHDYSVTFYMGNDGSGSSSLNISADGASQSMSVYMPLFNGFSNMHWQSKVFTFTATGTSTTLNLTSTSFLSLNGPIISSLRVVDTTAALPNNSPTGVPTLTGVAAEDQTLVADISSIGDVDGIGTFGYQWLRNGVDIAGASNSDYTPGDADVGEQISVRVSYIDGRGASESLVSAVTAPVSNLNDAATGVPAVTGTPIENQTLSADTAGISDADGLGTFSYQWLRNGIAISGATASTYSLGDADVNEQIQVSISYIDGYGTTENLTSIATFPVTNVNDAPVGIPSVTGTLTEDQTLSADTTGISDSDGLGTFSYQWLRNGVAISGATSSTYTLGDADVASSIRVRVDYTDANGTSESILSNSTAAISNVNDAPIGIPTVIGTLTEDQTLSADTTGVFDADGLGTFSYQWLRNGVAISGATSSTYTLGDADVASSIRVRVDYTDANGTAESILSNSTAAISNVNDAPVGVPLVVGSLDENQTLSVNTAGITDNDGLGTYSYQWTRDGVPVVGATASTFILTNADVNTQIRVQVSYVDANGNAETLTSPATIPITNVNDAPAGILSVIGTSLENQTLTADATGISDADGLGTINYQWLRNGTVIAGATNSNYVLGNADVGASIRAQISYTDGHGSTETITSAATLPVTNINDTPTGLPTIVGSPMEDQTLTANVSTIADADGLGTMSYQWLRNGADIFGATNGTYTLGDNDVQAQISVRVGFTDAHGTVESLTSAVTTPIINVNDAPVGLPAISGLVAENQTLTAITAGVSDIDGLGTMTLQWLRNGAPIAGETNSTYTLTNADVNAQIQLQVSYVDGNGFTETLTSAPTVGVGNVNDVPSGTPSIIGISTEDETLTADVSTIADADGLGTIGFQWLRNGSIIAGAIGSSYQLADVDVNHQIGLRVQYTDGHGTLETLDAPVTMPVVSVNDSPAGAITISGTTTEDQTLSVSTAAISDADGLGPFQYQWLRNGVVISGASGASYTLADSDVDAQISARVSYVDQQGTVETLTSAATSSVINVNDVPALPGIADQFIDLSTGTGPLPLNIVDVDNAVGTLTISVTSSNPEVAPLDHILIARSGNDWTIEILPVVTNSASFSQIVVSVSDGTATTQMTFYVATDSAFNSAFLFVEPDTEDEVADAPDQSDEELTAGENNVPQVVELLRTTGNLVIEDYPMAKTGSESKNATQSSGQIQAELKNISRNIAENAQQLTMMNSNVSSEMELTAILDSSLPGQEVFVEPDLAIDYQFVAIASELLEAGDGEVEEDSDVEVLIGDAIDDEFQQTTSSAIFTSVVAVGAITAVSKTTAVGALGSGTTTNTFLYVSSKGKLAAARTFETIVGHLSNLGGKASAQALICEQVTTGSALSSVSGAGGTVLATLASSIPMWCSFDPMVVLDRFAQEYGPHDAAERSNLASVITGNRS